MSIVIIGENIDASLPFESEPVRFERSYDWSLILLPTGLNADYRITLDVSDDNINFVNYKLDNQLIDHTKPEIIFDSLLPGDWFKIIISPDSNTSGTLNITMNVKYKS